MIQLDTLVGSLENSRFSDSATTIHRLSRNKLFVCNGTHESVIIRRVVTVGTRAIPSSPASVD